MGSMSSSSSATSSKGPGRIASAVSASLVGRVDEGAKGSWTAGSGAPKPKSCGKKAYRTSHVRALKAWRSSPDCTRIARTSSPKCSWASRMICWVMSSVKVYVVSLWMGILAIAMLLCPDGLLQRFCVVTVELLTVHDHTTRMHASPWLAEDISPGHRQRQHAYSRMLLGGTWEEVTEA